MELSVAIPSIAVALALGAMSPGPSFIMVARTSVAVSRRDGLAAALGMGFGAVVFSTVALLGLLAALTAVPLPHLGLKVLGGAYLAYLGVRIWRGARQPLVLESSFRHERPTRAWRSFALGFATQVSSPKTAVVYLSVFASLLPRGSHVRAGGTAAHDLRHRNHLVFGGRAGAVGARGSRPLPRVEGLAGP